MQPTCPAAAARFEPYRRAELLFRRVVIEKTLSRLEAKAVESEAALVAAATGAAAARTV
jgi:hypothetical protein